MTARTSAFCSLFSDQVYNKNSGRWNSPSDYDLQLWDFPLTKGRKSQVLHLSPECHSDTGFGTTLTLRSQKCQADLQTDYGSDFYVDSIFYLILTKDIYPHECNRVYASRTRHARNHWVCFCVDGQARAMFAASAFPH